MINKITEADLINKGVVGLPDVPGLTTIEMQNKFEEISRDVIIPRFNELIDNTVSASDEFSKLSTYNVGDYCIYQSVLYKCTTAITTAGEWDATKWKPTSIDKELVALNSNLDKKLDKIDFTNSARFVYYGNCYSSHIKIPHTETMIVLFIANSGYGVGGFYICEWIVSDKNYRVTKMHGNENYNTITTDTDGKLDVISTASSHVFAMVL